MRISPVARRAQGALRCVRIKPAGARRFALKRSKNSYAVANGGRAKIWGGVSPLQIRLAKLLDASDGVTRDLRIGQNSV